MQDLNPSYHQLTWYKSLWLSRTVLFRATITRTIMLHLLINPVSRYTLFFQLPKPFKVGAKPQNTNSALQITLPHPFKSGKLSHQRKENSGTAPSTIQTEASKKETCIIDSYFIIYMCCTYISISIYIIHIIRLVSLCTDVPPPSGKKSGEETSSPPPIFCWGRGDVCTQAID